MKGAEGEGARTVETLLRKCGKFNRIAEVS